jgi:hypothetical protein
VLVQIANNDTVSLVAGLAQNGYASPPDQNTRAEKLLYRCSSKSQEIVIAITKAKESSYILYFLHQNQRQLHISSRLIHSLIIII